MVVILKRFGPVTPYQPLSFWSTKIVLGKFDLTSPHGPQFPQKPSCLLIKEEALASLSPFPALLPCELIISMDSKLSLPPGHLKLV